METEDRELFSYDKMTGEFQTYTYVRSVVPAALAANNPRFLIPDNLGGLFTGRYGGLSPMAYLDYLGNITNYANTYTEYGTQSYYVTANRKYIVATTNTDWRTFEVYRYGVQIFTRDPRVDDADFNFMETPSISPNGRFIWICGSSIATGWRNRYLLYEGS